MSDFIGFPSSEGILASLQRIDEEQAWQNELFRSIADRLGSRVDDGAACTFILMETLHEFEDQHGQDLRRLLARCIMALTQDRQLADSAILGNGRVALILDVPDLLRGEIERPNHAARAAPEES